MKKIVFTNQKGGVGKTTLTRETGLYLSSIGYRVLLVDADPQGNLTKSLTEEGPGLYDALNCEGLAIEQLTETLSILKGDGKLALLEKHLLGEIDAYSRFNDLFSVKEFRDFDLLLVDTPPSLGVLTINALTACSRLVIPTTCGLYSLQGTNDLLSTVAKVKKTLNPALSILGVIINAYDPVPVITRQLREEIGESFGELVFPAMLSKSIRLEEAIAGRVGVKGKSRPAGEVALIGDELLARLGMIYENRAGVYE